MSDLEILSTLRMAFQFFNKQMEKLFELLLFDPESYMGGEVWNIVQIIFDGLLGSGITIMVICFYIEMIRSTGDMIVHRKFESYIWLLIEVSILGSIMIASKEILLMLFRMVQKMLYDVLGLTAEETLIFKWQVPDSISNEVNGLDSTQAVLAYIICFFGAIIIVAMCFTVLIIGYGRIFNLYIHMAVAPIPIAFAASKSTQPFFMSFLKSFLGTALSALIIIVACAIFSAFSRGYDTDVTSNNTSRTQQEDVSEDTSEESEDDEGGRQGGSGSFGEGSEGESEGDRPGGSGEFGERDNNGPLGNLFYYLINQILFLMLLIGAIKGSDTLVNKIFGMG